VLENMNHIDHAFFLFLNGIHNPFFDIVMFKATSPMTWIPLYLVFLYLIIRQYNWKTIVIVVLAAVMIIVSDQLANLFKDTFQRLRPSHEPGLMVHLVNAYKGGEYGFYSGHATNNFSIAIFLIILLGTRFKWIWKIALPYALIISYTRIYLGVHFPGDILAGAIIGSLIGYFFGRSVVWFLSQRKLKDFHFSFFHHNWHNRTQ
jgi:undecaprenyl-diphosphatase